MCVRCLNDTKLTALETDKKDTSSLNQTMIILTNNLIF